MDCRETYDGYGVVGGDGELLVTVVEEASVEKAGIDLKVRLAEAEFDRNFPNAGGAEEKLIVRIGHWFTSCLGNFANVLRRPDQQVGV